MSKSMGIAGDYVKRALKGRLAEVVATEWGVTLRKSGRNLVAYCQFPGCTDEKTPSFNVYENGDGLHYRCFSCGRSGDVFTFLEEARGYSFSEAWAYLGGDGGATTHLPSKRESEDPRPEAIPEPKRQAILRDFAEITHECLTGDARAYLRGRALTDATIDRVLAGSIQQEGAIIKALKERGHTVDECRSVGVLKERKGRLGTFVWQDFVVIPVWQDEAIVDCYARALPEAIERWPKGEDGEPRWPKHNALPKADGEEKRPFIGRAVATSEYAIIVEGEIDALSIDQVGLPVIATRGAAIWKSEIDAHIEGKKVYLCPDADQSGSGQRSAIRRASELGEEARLIELPGEDVDPNSLHVELGDEGFLRRMNELVAAAVDLPTYRIHQIPRTGSRDEILVAMEAVISEDLVRMQKGRAEACLAEVAKPHLGLDEDGLKGLVALLERGRGGQTPRGARKLGGKKKERPPKAIGSFEGLVDIVEDSDGRSAFLVKDGDDIKLTYEFRDPAGETRRPPRADQCPWVDEGSRLPRGEKAIEHYSRYQRGEVSRVDESLFAALVEWHRGISDLATDAHYQMLAAWDLQTYRQEVLDQSPIIWFYGLAEKGKTRTGKGMTYVAYRGIYTDCLREASLIRWSAWFSPSIFLDVRDLWRKALNERADDFLLGRFERGRRIPRVKEQGRDEIEGMAYYGSFGPTVFATNKDLGDELKSRSVEILMPESIKDFEETVTYEAALPLREMLTAYRARHLGKPLPSVPKAVRGRFGDITRPLIQVLHDIRPGLENDLVGLLRDLQKARDIGQSETPEGQFLKTLIDHKDQWERDGYISLKEVTAAYNEGLPERQWVREQTTRSYATKLGFAKDKNRDGSIIPWDGRSLESMRTRYGLLES